MTIHHTPMEPITIASMPIAPTPTPTNASTPQNTTKTNSKCPAPDQIPATTNSPQYAPHKSLRTNRQTKSPTIVLLSNLKFKKIFFCLNIFLIFLCQVVCLSDLSYNSWTKNPILYNRLGHTIRLRTIPIHVDNFEISTMDPTNIIHLHFFLNSGWLQIPFLNPLRKSSWLWER